MPTYANGPAPVIPTGGAGYGPNRQNVGEAVLRPQVAPASYAAVATITVSELLTRLLVCSGTTYTVTLPTAALLDAALSNSVANDSFDFSLVATSSGTITLGLGTGVTAVGTMTVATATATMFRLRKTGAGAWVVYRVG